MKNKIIISAIIALATATQAQACESCQKTTETQAQLDKLTKGNVVIDKEWSNVKMGGFWPVLVKQGGKNDFIYTNGEYFMFGNLVKADGSVSEKMNPVIEEAKSIMVKNSRIDASSNEWKKLSSMPGISEGTGGPKISVVFDPLCGYCQKLFKSLRDEVAEGKITIKWVPINNFLNSGNKKAEQISSTISSVILENGLEELVSWKTYHKLSFDLEKISNPSSKDLSAEDIKNIKKVKDLRTKHLPTIEENTLKTRNSGVNGTPYTYFEHDGVVDTVSGFDEDLLKRLNDLKDIK